MPDECRGCGLSWGDFLQIKRLGCPLCYQEFEDRLLKIFLKRDYVAPYPGEVPDQVPASPIHKTADTLRDALKRALEEENYEEAARIRDSLRKLSEGGSIDNGI